MADNLIEIIVTLKNLRQFLSGTESAAKGVENIGKETEKTGKKTGFTLGKLAKWSAVGTAVYGAQRYIRGAVSDVETLAKGTMALQRSTTLDTQTASEWIGVLKERNISTTTFQRGLITLSKKMESARGGSKTSMKSFTDLGISMDQVRRSDPSAMLGLVADRLKATTDPTKSNAAAQGLLSRAGLQLLPILKSGSEGINEQLNVQRRYGNYLSGNGKQAAQDLIKQQRELSAAMSGVKVTLGQALLPVLVQVGQVIVSLTRVLQPLIRNGTVLKGVIIALTIAFVSYKITLAIATVANTLFATSLAAWTLPIFVVVAALLALGVAFVVLYKKVDWFRAGVNAAFGAVKAAAIATFGWIKQNWPLLLGILTGPFGLLAVYVIRHFDKVKGAVLGAVSAIKNAINDLVGWIKDVPARIGGGLGSIASSAVNAIPGAHAARGLFGRVTGRQHGGPVTPGRRYLVGEQGPEVLTVPARGMVTPMQAAGVAGGGTIDIRIPVYLDRKQIAEAIGTYAADKLARR